MAKFDVVVTNIGDVQKVNALNKFETVTRVTIKIGDYGTFTKEFAVGENSPDAVNAWKQMKVNEVRAIVGE